MRIPDKASGIGRRKTEIETERETERERAREGGKEYRYVGLIFKECLKK